ncbi:MAG: hypothetical protein K2G05_07070 [Duncaniella sp.]|nr:hypothetical protein [Duncaniella sp.]
MTGSLIILAVTLLTGLILYLTRGRGEETAPAAPDPETADATQQDEVCCGRHAVCEKGLLRPDELYYDDEELDRFAGREPDSYTTDEINEFREVLYTLGATEVYAWGSALTQRDIALPLDLRDEWVMLCG